MKSGLLVLVVLIVAMLPCQREALAGNRGWKNRSQARRPVDPVFRYDARPLRTYTPYELYWLDAYPKYYGAIHARSIHTLGIPSGDLGLRGQPW